MYGALIVLSLANEGANDALCDSNELDHRGNRCRSILWDRAG